MEIVLATFISGVMAIISIFLLQRNKEKTMLIRMQYEKEMLQLKKKEGRKDKKLAATIQTKAPTSILDSIKGIDLDKVKGIIDMVQGDDYQDGGIVDTIGGIVQDNPEIVQGLLDGLNKSTNKVDDNIKFE